MSGAPAEVALSILRGCAAGRVRQISRVVTAQYDAHLRPLGITANQLTILALSAALGPSRSTDIEPYLAMEQSTLSRNLSRMVANGWLEKVPDPEDARSHLVEITDEGEGLLRDAHGAWEKAQTWAEELLGEGGMQGIFEVARKVNPKIP